MSDERIRKLWADPDEGEVVFKDVIDLFIEAQEYIHDLERKNTMFALKKVKSVNERCIQKMKEFQRRINREVSTEVVEAISRDGKIKVGNPQKLIDANNKRHGRNDVFKE